jgi:hypothetical protein
LPVAGELRLGLIRHWKDTAKFYTRSASEGGKSCFVLLFEEIPLPKKDQSKLQFLGKQAESVKRILKSLLDFYHRHGRYEYQGDL